MLKNNFIFREKQKSHLLIFFLILHCTMVLQAEIFIFFDVVVTKGMSFRFQMPKINQNVQYYREQNQTYREKEIVDLQALSRMGMYTDQVKSSCGSLPLLKNIHPSFVLSILSYLSWWTSCISMVSCIWIASMPPLPSVEHTFLFVELCEGT